jgi:uncharacterized membrane protein YgaE (UPF0421/DUF939 family)
MARYGTAARRAATRFVDRVRRRGRQAAWRAMRLTVPAVIAYVVARLIWPHTQPLTGPLTALLVVQVSLFATLTTGLRRVVSVVSGVVLAVLLSSVVDLTWWSLGTVIALAIITGQVLRLGENLLEVPISAMLVLGVSSAESAAASRVGETLVGAGVGVLATVLFPPPVQTRGAGAAVEQVATRTATVLERVADELAEATADQPAVWLEEVRRLSRSVMRADRALQEAEDSRRLNPRAMGTEDALPMLRRDLDALEHTAVALRQLFRAVSDAVRSRTPQPEMDDENRPARQGAREGAEDIPPDPGLTAYDAEVRSAFAVLLTDLARAIRAFGTLARAEAESGEQTAKTQLALALDALGEARALLTELLLVDARDDRTQWELHGSILAAVGRVLGELDLAERDRRREQWRRDLGRRSRTAQAVVRLRDTSRQVTEVPRRQLRRRELR